MVFQVVNEEKLREMRGNDDMFLAFAVYDMELIHLKSQVYAVLASRVSYDILSVEESEKELLFINAIDVAAGPEIFTGGLYDASSWKNVFSSNLLDDEDFLPVLIGGDLYLSSISEANVEQRARLLWDFDKSEAIVSPQ